MKKNVLIVLLCVLLTAVSVCFAADEVTVKVGASPSPHAEILNQIKDVLAEQNIKLEIVEFTDYVLPNTALEDGSLDMNFFQHKPYLDDFNASYKEKNSKWIDLIPVFAVHFEPMGIYGGKSTDINAVPEKAKIAVPNDTTNEARALLLLESLGIIKVKEGAGLTATRKDIVENPYNIDLIEMEAAQLPRILPDVDFAVINGNYAIEAGLKAEDMLAQEGTDSEAAQLYANVLVVREDTAENEVFDAVIKAIQSDAVKSFIEEEYAGAVVPMF